MLGHDIASGDTPYRKLMVLALHETCHRSSNASAEIARALAIRFGVADTLYYPRNTGRPEPT
jgi:hypothetical protein